MTQQPEALRHAEWLEKSLTVGATEAAAELRRLHNLCAEWEKKALTWLASPEAAKRLKGYLELTDHIITLEAALRQAQEPRQWKGLTEEEIWELAAHCLDSVAGRMQFARAIEAKLREKNT